MSGSCASEADQEYFTLKDHVKQNGMGTDGFIGRCRQIEPGHVRGTDIMGHDTVCDEHETQIRERQTREREREDDGT